jgi:hypothetical protein
MRRPIPCAALVPLLAVACDLPSAGHVPPTVGRYDFAAPVAGYIVTQTLFATAADGAPASTTVHLSVDSAGRRLGVRLGADLVSAGSDSIVITSDERGLVATTVSFRFRTGRAVVHVRAPEMGVQDSIVYSLPSGTVARLLSRPIVPCHVGDTRFILWDTFDASWRPVFGDPSLTAVDTMVAAFRSDDRVLAKTTGGTWVHIRQGTARDSAYLAVVPLGNLGAVAPGPAWTHTDLTGETRTTVFGVSLAFGGPRFSPSRDTLAYTDSGRIRLRLPGPQTVRLVPAALGFASDRNPAWSADGRWVYFTAAYPDGRTEIWRIRPDGTGAERFGPAAAAGEHDSEPSVSPDGALLAVTTNRTLSSGRPTVRILELGTGATAYSGPAGNFARFAPDGTRIAFISGGRVTLVNADGTGARTLTPALSRFLGQLAWSPDGRWIAVAYGAVGDDSLYLYLVDTSTDTAMRLPYALQWSMPDWR